MRIKKYDKVLFFLFAAMLISSLLIWAFEERFDQDDWRSNPLMRYKMVDDIVDRDLLIGKTKNEIILMLGEPQISNLEGKDHLIYRLGKAPSFFESEAERLVVIFENSEVTKVIRSEE